MKQLNLEVFSPPGFFMQNEELRYHTITLSHLVFCMCLSCSYDKILKLSRHYLDCYFLLSNLYYYIYYYNNIYNNINI